MRVVFWGTYDTGKPRTRILREGLSRQGVELHEIHASTWEGIEDKSQLRGFVRLAGIALRWLFSYPRLAWRLARVARPDLVLVGYPGHVDVFIAALVCRFRRIPVAWDVFLSAYDTICLDRRLLREGSLAARLLRRLEASAIARADYVFMDTQAHARRIERLFDLPKGHCDAVWVGVEAERFPRLPLAQRGHGPFRVLFYGQFIPLHGITTIIEAARLLRQRDIEWRLVGVGQEAPRIRALLDADPLPRVSWMEWVPYEALAGELREADICLGIFGDSEKAASVIPNKVFQIVASGRPLVTRDGPAARELLVSQPGCTYLVPCADAKSLADALLAHMALAATAQSPCHESTRPRIDATAIGEQFMDMIRRRNIVGRPS
ncbi:glycosyltransferase [Marilutibacter aestuarii]|uniref:Glycosyltransferase family 4 protein n=1 Tax=Marilutibacter aestuarii TaxID=1706195 RepID=A0A507ZQR3_9GAMM|nr:glycosyltransferase [Lysobacter aestuarii]TQD38951.1 glycosyltransferase family 4 protein [Lysobacter aestuarii]